MNEILSDPSHSLTGLCLQELTQTSNLTSELTDVTLVWKDAEFAQPLLDNDELNCWICHICYLDLSNSLHGFVILVTCIFQQNQTEFWPRF